MTLDRSLLLKAYAPSVAWVDRGTCYRQWRLLRGEGREAEGTIGRPLTMSNFAISHLLGEGNYSQVYACTLKSTQQPIALKIIDKSKVSRHKKEDEVRVEKYVLAHVRHPSLVVLHHTFQDVSALYLALELCAGGELWAISHKFGLPLSLARFYSAQMLEVLCFLHERGIVHRDVKPENVLLTADNHIKVIDFGTAKLIAPPPFMIPSAADEAEAKKERLLRPTFKEFVGTPEYMAPEAINNKPGDQRADIWSLGCFICQLVTGWPPFKGGSDYLTFKRVLARKKQFPEGMPPDAADLIDQLLVLEPEGRLGGAWQSGGLGVAGHPPAEGILADEGKGVGGHFDHSAIISHPFFGGLPCSGLHEMPIPYPSLKELALLAVCDRVRPRINTEERSRNPPKPEPVGAVVGGVSAISRWPATMKDAVVFEFGKRELLDEPTRLLFGLGPPPPPIVDDLEEFEKGGGSDDENDGSGDPGPVGEGGTVI